MKHFSWLLAFSLFTSSLYSQGVFVNDSLSNLLRQNPQVEITRSMGLPSSHSLEQYTPYVFNQGQSSMCAAYSLALARTILYARNHSITDRAAISAEAYSPYYIYTKYKKLVKDDDFDGGMHLYYINPINDFGYAKMKDVEYPHYYPFTEKTLWDFSVPSYIDLNQEELKNNKFSIIRSITLDNTYSPESRGQFVLKIKSELSEDKPIIFGMALYENFGYTRSESWSDRIVSECPHEFHGKFRKRSVCGAENIHASGYCAKHVPYDYVSGHHAMLVIGYDDNKHGGAFLIQNSWGKDWNQDGKVWITYDSFTTHAYNVQSLDKKNNTTIFDDQKQMVADQKNYPIVEVNNRVKDFSAILDFNWVFNTQLAITKSLMENGASNLPKNLQINGSFDSQSNLNGYAEVNLNNVYIYKGEFLNGLIHGQGELTIHDVWGDEISYKKGTFEEGDFKEGQVLITEMYWDYLNEDIYSYTYKGDYRDNDFNGNGVLTDNTWPTHISGKFENGWPIYGEIWTGEDYYYIGDIYSLYPHGHGKEVYGDEENEGEFEFGKFLD